MSCNAKKDPNGTWRIQYRWTDWTGTKKKSQKRGFKTKKEAEEWYAHFMLQQSSDPTMTLADFWEIYKADMEKRLRKTTMKQKEYVINDKVLPYFGKTPISEITAPMIRKWQGEMMEKGFKPTYLKTIHNQLIAILNYAVNFYDLRSNPCRKAGSIQNNELDKAETLLRQLPENIGDITHYWVQIYLKRGNNDKALELLQKRMFSLVNQTLMCLSLMIEKVQTDDNKALELCRIYKKIEETFEMKGKSSELVYALVYNRAGYEDRATDSIIRYLESCITDETVIPNQILFSPTIKFKQDNSSKKMRKEMILRGLSEDETFSKICENEDVKHLMEKLSSEV